MYRFLPNGPWDGLRRKVEEALDLPRGSTAPDHVFQSGGYRSSLPNEMEMARRLEPYVEDERKASEDYFKESELADLIGRPDIAMTLRSMSEDEHRHHMNILGMLKSLR